MILRAKDAIDRHMQWKVTLQTATMRREPLSAEHLSQIRSHGQCPIGQWLDSSATCAFRRHPTFCALVERHYDFHHEMGVIAALLTARRFREAGTALDFGSPFGKASSAITQAILAVDRLIPIGAAA